jgi:hypothetical protein
MSLIHNVWDGRLVFGSRRTIVLTPAGPTGARHENSACARHRVQHGGSAILSQPLLELALVHLNISKDLAHQARPNRLSRMTWNYSRSAVAMPQKMVTASNSQHHEPGSLQGGDYVAPSEAFQAAHLLNGDPLNPHKLTGALRLILHFETKGNGLSGTRK